jgi:hypothetical protein
MAAMLVDLSLACVEALILSGERRGFNAWER